MLTRELLIYRKYKDTVRPGFVDVKSEELGELARDLVAVVRHGIGERRGAIEEALEARVALASRPRIGRGLAKLLLDRADFEEPDEATAALRRELFTLAATVLREQVDDETARADYEAKIAAALPTVAGAGEYTLAALRECLHDDLAANRKLLAVREITGPALLDRYNLALVQGLTLYCRAITVIAERPDLLELRRVLRWLKFSRLVAEVRREGPRFVLHVEGPGAILDMQKKYGLQLSTFVAAVPLLRAYTLEAVVELPRRQPLTLTLTHKDPLVASDQAAPGYIPPEIEVVKEKFDDERWVLDLTPELRHVGVTGMCVPDFTLRPRAGEGPALAIELFHRWHRHALTRRLDELDRDPDPAICVGVDRALLADPALAARVEGHARAFVFNRFPSRRVLKALVRAREEPATSA